MRASRCELADSSPIITAPYPFSKNEKAGGICQLIALGKMQEIHNVLCLSLGVTHKKMGRCFNVYTGSIGGNSQYFSLQCFITCIPCFQELFATK